MLYLGAHLNETDNIIKNINKLEKIGGNVLQIFTGPPHSLNQGKIMDEKPEKINDIKTLIQNKNIKLFIHAKYLLNFAKPLIPKNKIFLVRYVQDLDMSVRLGGDGVVLHFGTTANEIPRNEAIKNMAKSLISCLDHADKKSVPILETTSGEGYYLGRTIEGMYEVYSKLPKKYQKRIKFCIDTCHIFVSGYEINIPDKFTEYVNKIQKTFGKNKIALIHLNDSKTPFNQKNDRHAEIGKGYIFDPKLGGSHEALKEIVIYAEKNNIPLLLETHGNFGRQIKFIKSLITNDYKSELIEQFSQLRDFHQALNNIHQFRAYKNIVNKLKQIEGKIESSDNLKDIEGIGKGILSKVDEYIKKGKIQVLESIKKDKKIMGQYELQKVYGIGPAFAKSLVSKKIYNIGDLKKALKNNIVQLNDIQLMGLKYYKDLQEPLKVNDAKLIVNNLKKILKKYGNYNLELMGGYRLGKKVGKDIDLIITKDNFQSKDLDKSEEEINKILTILERSDIITYVIEKGKVKLTLLIKVKSYPYQVHLDLRLAPKDLLPYFSLYFGSGEFFSRKIRQIAKDKGYKLNEYGLTDLKTNKKIILKSEKDIFKFLGVDYVTPINRL
jgi:apurinic endonuclease APN1